MTFRSKGIAVTDYLSGSAAPNEGRRPDREVCGCAKPNQRRLLSRREVELLLGLGSEPVQVLINTRQITRILIGGAERFDSRDIDGLIDDYKANAQRRVQ